MKSRKAIVPVLFTLAACARLGRGQAAPIGETMGPEPRLAEPRKPAATYSVPPGPGDRIARPVAVVLGVIGQVGDLLRRAPARVPRDVLTGFLTPDGEAIGRPVGVAVAADGAILIADDAGEAVWRVAPAAD